MTLKLKKQNILSKFSKVVEEDDCSSDNSSLSFTKSKGDHTHKRIGDSSHKVTFRKIDDSKSASSSSESIKHDMSNMSHDEKTNY